MRGGNAGFILRGVYRMQCAYHSSSWTISSVRVPVGWTCWQGCLFWVRTAAYISKMNRRTCWASPALNLKHMHVYTACGPNQWCAPKKSTAENIHTEWQLLPKHASRLTSGCLAGTWRQGACASQKDDKPRPAVRFVLISISALLQHYPGNWSTARGW